MSYPLTDSSTGKEIGKYVFTIFSNLKEQRNEILDVDIVLNNPHATILRFDKKLPQSSDSNEYYEAITADTDQHLVVETVNRYTVAGKIKGKKKPVFLSAFPFALTVFENDEGLNAFYGFDKPIRVKNTDLDVKGFDSAFICPGNVLAPSDDEESPWSFVIGKIKSYQKVCLSFGSIKRDAFLIVLASGTGDLPVLVRTESTETFDTKAIGKDKIISMHAYLKADFVKDRYPITDR